MRRIIRNILFLALALAGYSTVWAQEDLASTEEMLIEQKSINFQTFFFEALMQKAIGNFDKAIYALEACHDIDKDNVAVLFELSKNYGLQFKYTEAEYYAQMGLDLDPANMYLLRHLKEIKTKQNDFKGAIQIQRLIIERNPEEEADLVILFIKSGEIDQAIRLLQKLDSENNLPEGLVALKESLLQENKVVEPIAEEKRTESRLSAGPVSRSETLLQAFEKDKSFQNLIPLLDQELKRNQFLDLLEHSEEGISLFPAQPYVYLMKGTALNNLRKHGEAIETLEEGLEYLVDDPEMESQFMEQLSLAFKGMGDNKKASEYYNRAMEMKEKS